MDEPIFNKNGKEEKMEMVVMMSVLGSMLCVSLAMPMMLKRVVIGVKK